MLDLIARLEKAERPTRDLDAEIWVLVGCTAENSDADILSRLRKESPGAVLDDIWGAIWRDHGLAPDRYTSSIDAALTLVPEGFKVKLGYSKLVPFNFALRPVLPLPGRLGKAWPGGWPHAQPAHA